VHVLGVCHPVRHAGRMGRILQMRYPGSSRRAHAVCPVDPSRGHGATRLRVTWRRSAGQAGASLVARACTIPRTRASTGAANPRRDSAHFLGSVTSAVTLE
jgi:hypothetical protein